MNTDNSFFQTYKPGIPKRYLLFVAAIVWTVAGGMLLSRGFLVLKFHTGLSLIEELGSILAGILFYRIMFSAISYKHVHRILNLQSERPCMFSFFDWRSYIMMALMVTCGITLRLSGVVPVNYLSLFYIAMGVPLAISAFRFYYYFYLAR